MKYAKRIRDLREDNDKTQQDIADILKINRVVYARYETGVNELPIRHLVTLADYYNVTTDYICGRTDNPHSNNIENKTITIQKVSVKKSTLNF